MSEDVKNELTIELKENKTSLTEVSKIFESGLSLKHEPEVFGSHYLSYRICEPKDINLIYTTENGDSYTHNIEGRDNEVINMYFSDKAVPFDGMVTTVRMLERIEVISSSAKDCQYKK